MISNIYVKYKECAEQIVINSFKFDIMDNGKFFDLMDQTKWNTDFTDEFMIKRRDKQKTNKDIIQDCSYNVVQENLKEETVQLVYGANQTVEHVKVDWYDQDRWSVSMLKFDSVISMLVKAFNNHNPIAFTPDLFYAYIAKGFAVHFKNHAEELRPLFVGHDGKTNFTYENNDFVVGSVDNKWELFFEDIAKQLKDEKSIIVQPDLIFSTSSPIAVAHRHVITMDAAMEKNNDYNLINKCGIAAVIVLGVTQDWEKLLKVVKEQFTELNQFCERNRKTEASLTWWEPEVVSMLETLVQASSHNLSQRKEDEVKDWLSRVLKYDNVRRTGHNIKVSGWINLLFPYLAEGQRNPWFERRGSLISPEKYPTCQVSIPFKWIVKGKTLEMRALVGHMLLAQLNQDTKSSILPPGTLMLLPAWLILHIKGETHCKSPNRLNEPSDSSDPACAIV